LVIVEVVLNSVMYMHYLCKGVNRDRLCGTNAFFSAGSR